MNRFAVPGACGRFVVRAVEVGTAFPAGFKIDPAGRFVTLRKLGQGEVPAHLGRIWFKPQRGFQLLACGLGLAHVLQYGSQVVVRFGQVGRIADHRFEYGARFFGHAADAQGVGQVDAGADVVWGVLQRTLETGLRRVQLSQAQQA